MTQVKVGIQVNAYNIKTKSTYGLQLAWVLYKVLNDGLESIAHQFFIQDQGIRFQTAANKDKSPPSHNLILQHIGLTQQRILAERQ